ncbi:hypothetical protein AAG570_000719 [Ranatra chinensis]|uniref:G-protein coupled receptors family 2 profile 2 domain-containing protein n=1 Tax=Ranatra chinensis TaxID=642074 RepID=A0ABD0YXV9_9HEMI
MESKRRNMFYQNKKQETMEIDTCNLLSFCDYIFCRPSAFVVGFAFFIQFSFLASFFWLNVLCIHTWRQVRLSERQTPTTAGYENKSYVRYSMYAWSVPVFILVLSLALEFSPFASQTVVKPNFGVNSCWFHTNAGAAVLFYGPIAFVLLANLVFFGLIAKILWRNDIRSGMTTGEMKRLAWTAIRSIRMKTFKECVVLFCVMGLNWMMELISWGLGGPIALWLLTDIVNTLQGPIIFYLFVWRDETTRRHAKKLFCECKWRRKKRLPQTPPQPGSIAAGLLPAPTELKTFAVKETTPMSFSNAVLEVLKPPESTKNEMPAI